MPVLLQPNLVTVADMSQYMSPSCPWVLGTFHPVTVLRLTPLCCHGKCLGFSSLTLGMLFRPMRSNSQFFSLLQTPRGKGNLRLEKQLGGIRIRTGALDQREKNKEICLEQHGVREFFCPQIFKVLFASCNVRYKPVVQSFHMIYLLPTS